MRQAKNYAPIVLRIGISLVFLWFGSQQIFYTGDWVGWLPSFVGSLPIAATTFVLINGIFEVIFAMCLIAGFYTRPVSALLALHLLGIVFSVGYNEIGIRDFGLFMATLSIFLHGSDEWCLDFEGQRK